MRHLTLVVAAGLLSSCGVVGAPVAPETIGVAPTVERQKRQYEASDAQKKRELEAIEAQRRQAADAEEPDSSEQEHDDELPPLRPVGTR